MEFMLAAEPFANAMIGNILEDASSSAAAYNSTLNFASRESSTLNSFNIANANNATATSINRANNTFTGAQNALNRTANSTNLATTIQGTKDLQSDRFTSLNDLQTQRLQTYQNMQTTQNNASFARGALNLGGGLVNSGLQMIMNNQIASLQRQNFSYMANQAGSAFQASGLPSWMAYTQGNGLMNQLPRTSQVVNGSNMMNSSLPGNPQSQPWTGSESQSAFGYGDAPLAN